MSTLPRIPCRALRPGERLQDFVAFDFETATYQQMPCSLGITHVVHGQIRSSFSQLIQPPENRFDEALTRIHGIRLEHTKDALEWPALWHILAPYFESHLPLVAHNAPFDLGVLTKACLHYELTPPSLDRVYCTYKTTKIRLAKWIAHLNLREEDHHEAAFDSKVCALLALEYQRDPSLGGLI